MFDPPPLHAQRERADAFGSIAQAYHRYRPRYPDTVVDDLVALNAGGSTAEIGCGTGILTSQLRARGLDVTAVEPDPEMAAVAGIVVEPATFETWDAGHRRFDTIVFANSWHWVDDGIAVPKAHRLLRPGGHLVLLWYAPMPSGAVRGRIDAVYARDTAFETRVPVSPAPMLQSLRDHGFDVHERSVVDERRYTTQAWLDMVFTFSNHILLDADHAAALRADLADAIGPDGLTLSGNSFAVICRRQ